MMWRRFWVGPRLPESLDRIVGRATPAAMSETIFALATGRPPAAIAIVRISGATAHGAGAAIAGDLPPPRQAVVRTLRSAVGDILDQALVLRFDGPASATGEDV